jgi:hypothetical protein
MLSLCPRDLGHETNKGAQRRSEAGGGPMYNFEYQMQHTWIFPENRESVGSDQSRYGPDSLSLF